jgi:hypothetical protein
MYIHTLAKKEHFSRIHTGGNEEGMAGNIDANIDSQTGLTDIGLQPQLGTDGEGPIYSGLTFPVG